MDVAEENLIKCICEIWTMEYLVKQDSINVECVNKYNSTTNLS